jgi:hypothetical protein
MVFPPIAVPALGGANGKSRARAEWLPGSESRFHETSGLIDGSTGSTGDVDGGLAGDGPRDGEKFDEKSLGMHGFARVTRGSFDQY